MQITRTKKALVALIALVLVGIFVAVAAVYLPGAENTLPIKDNTVADTGSGADTVSTVSASSTAPLEDGTVPSGYQPSGTGISDISAARGDLDGEFYLTDNITIDSLDTSGNTFSGTLDGNGKTITINATASGGLIAGGLFSKLSGTVKNAKIAVQLFSFNTGSAGQRDVGIIAGVLNGGTVDNVKITLSYSPTGNDPSQGIGNIAAYFYDNGQHSGQSLDTFFGGVAGSSIGGTIKNTTVHNATSGSYGVSIVTANKKPTFSSASSDNAIGLFIGCATGGTTYLTNIRVVENSDSKIRSNFYQASHDKRSLIGVIWGWGWSESTINVDGVIYDNAIDFDRYVHNAGNQGIGTKHAGSMHGWQEGGISVKNVFAPEEMTWIDGTDDSIRGTIYTEDKVVAFDDNNTDNVIVKATFANPTAETITSTITVGNSTTSVLQALTVGDGETAGGTTAYVSVRKSAENLNGTNYSIAYGNASKGTMDLTGASFTENREDGYYSSREYDGNAEAARSISLSSGKTIDNVYVDNSGLGKNVGTHTLAYDAAALGTDYKIVTYSGINYIVGNDGYVYSPDNITINGEQSVIDVTKNHIVEITKRAITLGNSNGNVTYGDTLDVVQTNNIPVATSGSVVSGEYVESCTIDGYVQFAVNAGSEASFSYTNVTIKDAEGNDVTGNYEISYGTGSAVVSKKTIEGTLSVEDLVYSNSEKTAVFTATEGMGLFNGDEVVINYSGDRENVTAEGFTVTAAVPTFDGENSNYTFAEGSSVSQTFTIKPCRVTISANDDAVNEYEYSGVVPNSVLLTLFNAPEGLAGETLFLNFDVTLDGEEATVQYVGTYTVTATLAGSYQNEEGETVSQTNYIADSCDATITIKAKEINVSLSDVENSKTYDGAVVGDDYLQTMFVVDGEVAEGHVAELEITVAEGEIKNAGVYNISVALPSHYDIMYAISATSTTQTTYTVGQVVIDGEISAPEDSVYDGSEKFATFVFAEGCEMVGSDEIILTYATQGGQGVTQVVSAGTYTVSAALPAFAAGKSNYKWASDEIATKDIVISKAPVTITANSATAEKQFDGVAFDDYASLFTAPLAVDGMTDLALVYSVSGAAENVLNAGVYTVTATLADNGTNANYTAESASVTYTVDPKTVEIVWSENNYTYTGSVQTVTATYNDVNSDAVELAVSFGEGVEFMNAGEYTATAGFAEGDNALGNYVLPENVTNNYNIKKADSVIDTDGVVKTYTYTGELQTIDSGATLNHSEAELVYSNNTFTTVAEGNGMEVVISVADTANYNGTGTTVQITVNKATPAVTASVEMPEGGLFTSSEMPVITANFGETSVIEGVIAWNTTELKEGANEYAWTFTPTDTDNYNVVKGNETLNVQAVAIDRIEVVSQPDKADYQYGDKFDKAGMVVEAVNNDGSRVVIEEYTVADEYLTALGENMIEISYDGKTATVTVNVDAKSFEIEYSDLTVVVGSEDFHLANIEASIVGTEGNTVNIAGSDYTYSVALAYTDAQYDAGAEVGTEYPLTVTVTVTDLDAQYYIGEYTAILRVIATSMEGSWVSETVTAEYDGNTHAAEFNKTIGGDFEIQYAVSGTDVWSTEVPVNAGEYVAKVVSLDEGYSADRLPTATVTINKKSVEISAVSGTVSADYNGTAFTDYASLFNAPSGVNDEGALELAFTVTKDGETAEILGAGTYTVTATLANADGNYTAEACVVTYTVAPAEVSVNWTGSSSVVYSGEAYEPTFEATGLVGDDQLTVTYQAKDGSALTGDKARNAGSYTAIVSLSSDNYVFAAETSTTFDFTVEKVKVSYSALLDGNTKYVEYGGDYVPSVDDFYSTSVENSNKFEFYIRWSLEFDLSGITTANAGTKYEAAVEGVVRYAGGADISEEDYANFELIGDVVDIVVYVEITAKQLTITATDGNATYDGEKVGVEELLAMFGLGGIDVKLTVDDEAYDYADIKNVGSYNVVVASANGNYEFIGDTDATFTVEAADMTDVIVTGYNDEYDKAAHNAVANATATTVDGIEVTFTYATSEDGVYGTAPEYTDAGNYTVYYKAVAANHNEMTGSFTVTISKAVVDLPEIESKPYNGEIQTATIAESTVYSVTKNEGGINAGDYEVTIVLADTANYAWAGSDEDNDGSVTLTFTVTKVANAWTTEPAIDGWTYGAAANEPEGDALYGDVSFSYQTASGEPLGEKPVNAGSYILVATVDGNTNYEGLSMTVEFAVAKADYDMSSVVFENASKVYNGETQSITVDGVLPDGVTVSYSEGIRNAGSIVITATFTSTDANYNVPDTMTATLTVTAKELTVENVTALNRVYDGTTAVEVTGSLAGVIGSDDVTLEISGTMADKNVGENKNVTVAANISGADSGNYTIADVDDVIVTVTAKEITVVWSNTSLTYNGESQAPTATAETGVAGETVAIEVKGAAVEPGTYKATATISDTNYKLANAAVGFSIVKKEVVAEITAGYGELTVNAEGGNEGVQYKIGDGEWTALPADGKISVELAASWTVSLRYDGQQTETVLKVYTTAENVVTYLENNLSDSAIENKSVIETAENWLATATGDKTDAEAKLNAAKGAYEAEKGALKDSVENAFKATAKLTTRTFAEAMAIVAVSGLGIAVGAIALVRKGGRKDENK